MVEAARELWASLHLLDRQLVDRDGTSIGKVDDLELTLPNGSSDLPVVSALLCGQAALARRLHPRLGRALEMARRMLAPSAEPGPGRIPTDHIIDAGIQVRVALDHDDAPTAAIERWLAHEVLSHVPGSGISAVDEGHDDAAE